jgi:hypothetical protein
MGKRQTRRTISLKGLTYQRLKDYCDAEGHSVSGYLEDIIKVRLDALRVPVPETLRPRGPTAKRAVKLDAASGIFTF